VADLTNLVGLLDRKRTETSFSSRGFCFILTFSSFSVQSGFFFFTLRIPLKTPVDNKKGRFIRISGLPDDFAQNIQSLDFIKNCCENIFIDRKCKKI
jgi:hypothetical protein